MKCICCYDYEVNSREYIENGGKLKEYDSEHVGILCCECVNFLETFLVEELEVYKLCVYTVDRALSVKDSVGIISVDSYRVMERRFNLFNTLFLS